MCVNTNRMQILRFHNEHILYSILFRTKWLYQRSLAFEENTSFVVILKSESINRTTNWLVSCGGWCNYSCSIFSHSHITFTYVYALHSNRLQIPNTISVRSSEPLLRLYNMHMCSMCSLLEICICSQTMDRNTARY